MTLQYNRRRLFWLLQKWSSYTVWAHYARQFDVFVKAYEEALATWPDGERPPEYNVRFAYLAQDLYPKGLAALAKGDRSMWRTMREDADLRNAAWMASKAMDGITSAEINKYDGGERGVPRYTVWTDRLEQLRLLKEAATPRWAEFVYESRPTYADWHPIAYLGRESLPEAYFQSTRADQDVGPLPTHCPDTPPPTNILVKSGQHVTHDGIWELVFPHRAPGETDALNYFVKGAMAPWINDRSHEYVHGKQFALAVTWRLVWEDTRYLDGVIPDESFYLNPAEKHSEAKEQALATDHSDPARQKALQAAAALTPPSPDAPALGTLCRSGEPCPQSGYWQAVWPAGSTMDYYGIHEQFFYAKDTFPEKRVERRRPGILHTLLGFKKEQEPISWKLVRYG
jgi:hypothetical protein